MGITLNLSNETSITHEQCHVSTSEGICFRKYTLIQELVPSLETPPQIIFHPVVPISAKEKKNLYPAENKYRYYHTQHMPAYKQGPVDSPGSTLNSPSLVT